MYRGHLPPRVVGITLLSDIAIAYLYSLEVMYPTGTALHPEVLPPKSKRTHQALITVAGEAEVGIGQYNWVCLKIAAHFAPVQPMVAGGLAPEGGI